MNPASIDIKDMLEDASLGLIYKDNLWVAKEPAKPDKVVTVFDTPSFPPDGTLSTSEYYFRSSIQIRVRDNDYEDGMTLLRNIMDYLHARANETWNGTLYTVIRAMGEPAPLAWDDNNRVILIINFNLQRR